MPCSAAYQRAEKRTESKADGFDDIWTAFMNYLKNSPTLYLSAHNI